MTGAELPKDEIDRMGHSPILPIRVALRRGNQIAEASQICPPELSQLLKGTEELAEAFDVYLADIVCPASEGLERIRQKTVQMDWEEFARGCSSGDCDYFGDIKRTDNNAAQVLKMLVSMSGAKSVLELGMFTGAGALAMAEAVPSDGEVITCDIEPNLEMVVRDAVDQTPHGKKIKIRIGNAVDILDDLWKEGKQFDFIFIDADKSGYIGYYQTIMDKDLLAPRGTICVDNTSMFGSVYMPEEERPEIGDPVVTFNNFIKQDNRVKQVILPVRDGMMLIRRTEDVDQVSA